MLCALQGCMRIMLAAEHTSAALESRKSWLCLQVAGAGLADAVLKEPRGRGSRAAGSAAGHALLHARRGLAVKHRARLPGHCARPSTVHKFDAECLTPQCSCASSKEVRRAVAVGHRVPGLPTALLHAYMASSREEVRQGAPH